MAINWNILNQGPSIAQSAAQGYQFGTELKAMREARNKKKEGDEIYQRINEMMENPDFNLLASNEIADLAATRPDLVQGAMMRYEGLSKQRKKKYEKDLVQAKTLYEAGDVQGAMDVFGDRIVDITKKGGMPEDSIRAMQIFRENPEKFVSGVNEMLTMETGKDYVGKDKVDFATGLTYNPVTGKVGTNEAVVARLNDIQQQKNALKDRFKFTDRRAVTNDVTKLVSDANALASTANSLEVLRKNPSGPAAVASIYKFMKSLDPESTVMQGEIASAENSGGIPEYVRNFYNKIANGEAVSQDLLVDFEMTAKNLANQGIQSARDVTLGYLNTLADEMPASFYTKQLQRVPKLFDVTQTNKPITQENPPPPPANPADPNSIDALEEEIKRLEQELGQGQQ